MSKHNDIYNILGKLKGLEPAPAAPKQDSVLKTLNEHSTSLVKRLNDRYQESKQLNEYFHFDMPKGKDRGPRDTGTDELERRSKLGKDPLIKHGAEYKQKDKYGNSYKIGGPKGPLPESEVDEDVLIAKKDFDGDGKKESPKDEYMGSRDKAIKRSMGQDDKAEEGNKFTGNLAKARAAGKDQADLDGDGELEKVQKEGEYQDKVDKSKIPAFQRKAKGGDWRVDLDDLDDEASKSPTGRAGLEKLKQRMRDDGVMEAFPTVDDAKKRAEQEKGTGKFDKQTTSTGTRYTRKPETYADDNSEESGSSDAPKKRGRPAKNKGPERVTGKAWKHKGSRKTNEAINIETVVEDTMQELDDLLIMEKSVSKAQQRFMGMVYAAKKGDKPASKEVAKAAKGMSKKDAKDFAKTKHKGLPDRVDESIKPNNPALDSICHRYGKECNDFMTSGAMDDDLYHALHDHYYDDMPAAVKRGADTRDWVSDQFYADMGGNQYDGGPDSLSAIPPSVNLRKDDELSELARLAGLEESACNMTAEGQYCEVHGMNECGMSMYEAVTLKPGAKERLEKEKQDKEDAAKALATKMSGPPTVSLKKKPMDEASKPDFLDLDKDGDKEESMKDAAADKEELEECDMGPMANGMSDGQSQDSGMSVSTSVDTRTGRKTININADGETAEQIAQILKMAGLSAHQHAHAEQPQPQAQVVAIGEEFANKPEAEYKDADAIFSQGGDLNKKKKQDPKTANKAANPLKEEDNEIVERLRSMYNRF